MPSRRNEWDMVVPFGKHRDRYLSEIDSGYLKWMVENIDNREELIEAVETELEWRDDHDGHWYESNR